jgi:hypothetical protein
MKMMGRTWLLDKMHATSRMPRHSFYLTRPIRMDFAEYLYSCKPSPVHNQCLAFKRPDPRLGCDLGNIVY